MILEPGLLEVQVQLLPSGVLPIGIFAVGMAISAAPIFSQATAPAPRPPRPIPPTRDPATPGYVAAKELPDDTNAPANVDGNFILGTTHSPRSESTPHEGVPKGTIVEFTMNSTDRKLYPRSAREPNTQRNAHPPGQN